MDFDDDDEPKKHKANTNWVASLFRNPLQATPCNIAWTDPVRQKLIRDWLEKGEPRRMMLPVQMEELRYAVFELEEREIGGVRMRVVIDSYRSVYCGKVIE